MIGVHVGLHLEDKAGDFLVARFDGAADRRLGARRGRIFGQRIQKLRNAEIIDEHSSTDEVALGSTVTVTAERKSHDYLIVGSTEADPSGEPPKISNESPLGKALIGRKVGEKVVVTLPNGNEINYTIKKIS